MDANRCMYCNEIITEDRQICPNCEYRLTTIGMILQSNNTKAEQAKKIYEWLFADKNKD